jgi:hypothetical protein
MVASTVGNGRHSATSCSETKPVLDEPQPGRQPPAQRSWTDHFNEILEYALHYFEVRKDELTARGQKILLKVVLGLLAGIAGGTAVVVAVVLALTGLADVIGWALNGHYWAGKLIVGFGLIAAVAIGIIVYKSRYIKNLRTKTLAKYEHRHRLQRQRFGRDVDRNS